MAGQITSTLPRDWQDLQNEVGCILKQCGFNVQIEKKVDTARGKVTLDVYAKEIVGGRKHSIACECKYWGTKIPQTVIHSFRTVLSDMGVNAGYIISLNGFQPGALKASEHTNLRLVTWQEFQEEFCDTWLNNYLSPVITQELEPFLDYVEPLPSEWMCNAPDYVKSTIQRLQFRYIVFGVIVMKFVTYTQLIRKDGFPKLPLSENLNDADSLKIYVPKVILEAKDYREFLNESLKYGKQAIKEFDKIKGQCWQAE